MFHAALNAPVTLILLYAFALLALMLTAVAYFKRSGQYLGGGWLVWYLVAALLLGVGLAILGTAYLHDVWYC